MQLTAAQKAKAEAAWMKNQRYMAKQTIILRKAKEQGITATEAEVDKYLSGK